jgi:hypothetical protein
MGTLDSQSSARGTREKFSTADGDDFLHQAKAFFGKQLRGQTKGIANGW